MLKILIRKSPGDFLIRASQKSGFESLSGLNFSGNSLATAQVALTTHNRREGQTFNKHLMTGPKGNSEFCFPSTLNVPIGFALGNIEGRGETKLTVS